LKATVARRYTRAPAAARDHVSGRNARADRASRHAGLHRHVAPSSHAAADFGSDIMILRGEYFSPTLQMETRLSLVIPDGAGPRGKRSAVYLLHGLCGRSGDWIDYTTIAGDAARGGAILIMPEVARSFYADMRYGLDYFSYVADELPTVCADLFNLDTSRERTGVVGASMGGFGALRCALSRPERFGWCAAFSAPCLNLRHDFDLAARGLTVDALKRVWGERLINDFQAILGETLSPAPALDIPALARGLADAPVKPRIRTACGLADPAFLADNRRFAAEMATLDVDFAYDEWDGGHDWAFFATALDRTLRWAASI
jgi:S-formylglutathione hydrolase FrmB